MEDNVQRGMEDPYLKAWREWVERDGKERQERSRRMERQDKLSKSWEMVRVCRDIIKENYSDWQERKNTEEEKRKLKEIEE